MAYLAIHLFFIIKVSLIFFLSCSSTLYSYSAVRLRSVGLTRYINIGGDGEPVRSHPHATVSTTWRIPKHGYILHILNFKVFPCCRYLTVPYSFFQVDHLKMPIRSYTVAMPKSLMEHRKCLNDPDRFCYICGEFTPGSLRRPITKAVKLNYKSYFKCPLGDQDKSWAPHIACKPCVSHLSG